jgi:hypothetical protein
VAHACHVCSSGVHVPAAVADSAGSSRAATKATAASASRNVPASGTPCFAASQRGLTLGDDLLNRCSAEADSIPEIDERRSVEILQDVVGVPGIGGGIEVEGFAGRVAEHGSAAGECRATLEDPATMAVTHEALHQPVDGDTAPDMVQGKIGLAGDAPASARQCSGEITRGLRVVARGCPGETGRSRSRASHTATSRAVGGSAAHALLSEVMRRSPSDPTLAAAAVRCSARRSAGAIPLPPGAADFSRRAKTDRTRACGT